MKRSEVNSIIKNSIDFFEEYKFRLPEWAYWSPENWKGQSERCAELTDKPLDANIDGIIYTVKPGEQLILKPGQSICLKPYRYHRFYGQKGFGKVLIGEVSTVNDDENDNRFYEQVGRFPAITEDSKPLHLLVSDYKNYL